VYIIRSGGVKKTEMPDVAKPGDVASNVYRNTKKWRYSAVTTQHASTQARPIMGSACSIGSVGVTSYK